MDYLDLTKIKTKLHKEVTAQMPKETSEKKPSDKFFYETKRSDRYGDIYDLGDGVEARTVPDEYRSAIEEAHKEFPDISKGTLEAILMMESSMGADQRNREYGQGNYGWLGGYTRDTYADRLKNRKDKFEKDSFLTAPESIKAIARLYDDKARKEDEKGNTIDYEKDAARAYVRDYASPESVGDPEKKYQKFRKLQDFYNKHPLELIGRENVLQLTPEIMNGLRGLEPIKNFKNKFNSRSGV